MMAAETIAPPRLATFLTDDLVQWRIVFRRVGRSDTTVVQPLTLDQAKAWLRGLSHFDNVTRASIERIPLTEVFS